MSNRTEHVKLRAGVKGAKSGSGSRRLTNKQRFKLERYSFLDKYTKTRGEAVELGTVST